MAAAPPPPSTSPTNMPHGMSLFHPPPVPPPTGVSVSPGPIPPPPSSNTPPPPPSANTPPPPVSSTPPPPVSNTPPPPPNSNTPGVRPPNMVFPPPNAGNITPARSNVMMPPPVLVPQTSLPTPPSVAPSLLNLPVLQNQPSPSPPPPPPSGPDPTIPPNQTVYVNNLNDKIKTDVLKRDMQSMFKQFGPIREIIAMKSFWRRGQVWIVFADVESATRALNGMQGFVYHGKHMRINYALSKSDLIAKEEGTYVKKPPQTGPKKPRAIREKEEKQKAVFLQLQQQIIQQMQNLQQSSAKASAAAAVTAAGKTEDGTDGDASRAAKRRAVESGGVGAGAPVALGGMFGGMPDGNPLNFLKNAQNFPPPSDLLNVGGLSAPPAVPAVPNSILFVENIGENVTKEKLDDVFSKKLGFQEIRYIQSRRLAFAHFENEIHATHAMNTLQGYNLGGSPLKITYAKK